jgi:YHS domain-containing protein
MRTQHLSLLPLYFAVSAACSKVEQPPPPPAREEPARVQPAPVQPAPAAKPASPAPAALVRVAADKVCMMNDHFMGVPQIPVPVDGKTYYGCCPMCERKLREQPDTRFGVDPVSKKRVDKAGAVIGKLESGKVLYFETEQTFRAYQQQT